MEAFFYGWTNHARGHRIDHPIRHVARTRCVASFAGFHRRVEEDRFYRAVVKIGHSYVRAAIALSDVCGIYKRERPQEFQAPA